MQRSPYHRYSARLLALLLFLALLVAGCNSSSSSSSDPSPEGENGTALDTDTLILEGAVRSGSPIANAIVTLESADHTLETEADDDGIYRFEFEHADHTGMIRLVADGVGDQEFVEFESFVGEIDDLVALADEDADTGALLLTATDRRRLNLTTLSTTWGVFAVEANDDDPITDKATLAATEDAVSAGDLLQFAALLTAWVDNPDVTIAEEAAAAPYFFDSTLSRWSTRRFMRHREWRRTEYDRVRMENPQALDDATDAILDDEALVDSYDEDTVPPEYWTHSNFQYTVIDGENYRFNSDGTGHYITQLGDHSFTWNLVAPHLWIFFDDEVTQEGFCWIEEEDRQVRCLTHYDDYRLTLLRAGDLQDTLSMRRTGRREYPDDGGLDAHDYVSRFDLTGAKEDAIGEFDSADMFNGQSWALPSNLTQFTGSGASPGTELITFTDSENAQGEFSGNLNWSFDEGRLIMSFGDDTTVTTFPMHTDGEFMFAIGLVELADGSQRSQMYRALQLDTDFDPGVSFFTSDRFLQHEYPGTFGFDFFADNESQQVGWDLDDETWVETHMNWSFALANPSAGQPARVSAEYWRDEDNDFWGREEDCPGSNCWRYHERVWEIMREGDPRHYSGDDTDYNRVYIHEILYFDRDGDGDWDDRLPRINFYSRFQE